MEDLPILVQLEDQGPDSVCCHYFEQHELHLRTWYFHDPWHLLHNCVKKAASKCRLNSMIHLTSLVIEIGHGPWSGKKWHQVLRETVSEHLSKGLGRQDPILHQLLDRISEDQGWLEVSFEQKLTDALECLKTASFLHCVGPTTQSSRWCSWLEGWETRDSEVSLLLYVLLLYCIDLGMVQQDPSGILEKLASSFASSSSSMSVGSKSTSMKDVKDHTQRLRSKCHNKLHMCTLVLSDRSVVLQARQFLVCCSAFRSWYSSWRHKLRDRKTVCKFHTELAVGEGLISISETLQIFADASKCSRMGMLVDQLCNSAQYQTLAMDDALVLAQDKLCYDISELVLALAHYRLSSLATIMWSFPHQFLRLAGSPQELSIP